MNKIFDNIFGFLCYGIGLLQCFDIISIEDIGDPFPLIFVLLGSLLIKTSNKNK